MLDLARRIIAACLLVGGAWASFAEEPAKYWSVIGVRSDDMLHLRDVPSADSKSLARIPANARGLKHLGCRRNQPPMDQWARMSEKARREAMTQWCRVEYHGQQGWVAARFLKPDTGPRK
jgi:predicted Fe-S protein YdhL (DUF1289 family)